MAKINDTTLEHLGQDATERDLEQFIAAAWALVERDGVTEEEATEAVWNNGRFDLAIAEILGTYDGGDPEATGESAVTYHLARLTPAGEWYGVSIDSATDTIVAATTDLSHQEIVALTGEGDLANLAYDYRGDEVASLNEAYQRTEWATDGTLLVLADAAKVIRDHRLEAGLEA